MGKIFVIDDDRSIGEVISQMLELEGYTVRNFLSAKSSISKLREENPDLILLDYFLPGEDVTDAIYKLKQLGGSDLPIILMSASIHAAHNAKNLPVNDFLSKPFQRENLIDIVNRNII